MVIFGYYLVKSNMNKLEEETEQETEDRKKTLLNEFNDLVRKVFIIALVLAGVYFLLYFFA